MPAHAFYRSAAARTFTILTLAALTVTSVSACREDQAQVVSTPIVAGEAASATLAPAVEALPAATKKVVVTRAAPSQPVYRYVEDAYELDEAFGDAPPDYGFDYGGVQPWVWRTAGDAWRMVEPTAHGERYYFYEPGRKDPYLVRDPDYSYAYDDGRLVNVYDRSGRVLDYYEAERRADWASRYYSRARSLRQAAQRDRREQIAAANWQRRQARIEQDRRAWVQERQRVAAWRAYQDRQDARDRRELRAERERRRQASYAYRQWRERDYQGPPPRVLAAQERKRDWQVWKREQQQEQRAAREQHRREQIWAQRERQQQVRQQQARQETARKQQIWAQREQKEKARQQRVWAERTRQQEAQVRQAKAHQHKVKQQEARQQQAKQQQAKQQQAKQQQARQAQARQQQARQQPRRQDQTHANRRPPGVQARIDARAEAKRDRRDRDG